MGRKKKDTNEKTLTALELEVMQEVWLHEEVTIRMVVDGILKHREVAYTTIATIFNILLQKNFLKIKNTDEKSAVYKAKVSKDEYESHITKDFVTNVFQGEPANLVMRLLDSKTISKDELLKIKKLLKEKLG